MKAVRVLIMALLFLTCIMNVQKDAFARQLIRFELTKRPAHQLWRSSRETSSGLDMLPEIADFYDIALDEERGLLYLSESKTMRVYVLRADNGTFIRFVGIAGQEDGAFLAPRGLEVDPEGNVYVCDSERGRVDVFDYRGTRVRQLVPPRLHTSRNWTTPAPADVAVRLGGAEVWIGDKANSVLWVFNQRGEFVRYVDMPGREIAQGRLRLKFDPAGVLVISGRGSGTQLFTYDPYSGSSDSWEVERRIRMAPAVSAHGFDFDREGNIVVVDRNANGLVAFLRRGMYMYHVSTEDGLPLRLQWPSSVEVTEKNIMYVACGVGGVSSFQILGVPPPAQIFTAQLLGGRPGWPPDSLPHSETIASPSFLEAQYVAGEGISLAWTPVPGAVGYRVNKVEQHSYPVTIEYWSKLSTREPRHMDRDIVPGLRYSYHVSAATQSNMGLPSTRTIQTVSASQECKVPSWVKVKCPPGATFSTHGHRVILAATKCAGVGSYCLYRRGHKEEDFRLHSCQIEPAFLDDEVNVGQSYSYLLKCRESLFSESPCTDTVKVSVTADGCDIELP